LPIIALLAAALPGCLSTGRKEASLPARPVVVGEANQRQVNSILKTAFSQVGNPYRYGGASPETGFDCSGFVGWVYGQYGVSLPRSSRDMLAVGEAVEREELRPGDLVFFNYGYSHVGIYTGGDKYIHSPSTGKTVQESNLSDKGRGDRFVGGRRIIDNHGVSAINEGLKSQWIAQSRHQQEAEAKKASSGARAGTRAAAETAPKPKVHKVASGDNLVTLARRYGVTVNDIVAANSLADRHKLKIGQRLTIPQKKPSAQTAKNKAKPKP
jgi:LysM repeat protein